MRKEKTRAGEHRLFNEKGFHKKRQSCLDSLPRESRGQAKAEARLSMADNTT